ncbi:MAG: FtsQ-type POTRA domain-containing protein [Chlorobi bacterium]|nr:FtsQ-type POTRA domain-containing protein [Chlorobiota bacterium]
MSDSEYTLEQSGPEDAGTDAGSGQGGSPGSSGDGRGNWKAVLVVLLVVFSGLAGLATYASRWKKEVVVREVVIEGADIIPRSELFPLLKGSIGTNLQNFDVGKIRGKLLAVPYIREVSLTRELNGIIRVRVVEREPLALTVYRNRPMVIDTEGVLLPETKGGAVRFSGLIRVFGVAHTRDAGNGLKKLSAPDSSLVMALTEALRRTDYARLLIREIHLEGGRMPFCRAAGSQTRFILGSDGNFKEKLKKFEIFWQKVVSKKGPDNFHTVDLRFRDRIFTRDSVAPEIQQQFPL